MISTHYQSIRTARGAVLENVRLRSTGKPFTYDLTLNGNRLSTLNPRCLAHRVWRTAVRFAPQRWQTGLNYRATSTRVRKRLILNRKIKAQMASQPRP